jgi:hypothetical protein
VGGGTIAVLALAVGSLMLLGGSPATAGHEPDRLARTIVGVTASTVSLSEVAADPVGLALGAEVGQGACSPEVWDFFYSTAGGNGPWRELGSQSNSAYRIVDTISGLTPGASYWWQVSNNNSCSGNSSSAPLEVTQPDVGSLNYTPTASTSGTLRWTNEAEYGGSIVFESYQVAESIAGGNWTTISELTNVARMSFNLSGLVSGTPYRFQITTTDQVAGTTLSTASNVITVGNQTNSTTSPPPAGSSPGDGSWIIVGIALLVGAFMAGVVLFIVRRVRPPSMARN